MKVSEVYQKYQILPSLQQHMYRVAGVASLIAENYRHPVNTRSLLTACLLHDMGNIIKFDMTLHPDLFEPEGIDHWIKVKELFINRFGNDEHVATLEIAKEIGVSLGTLEIISSIGFSKAVNLVGKKDRSEEKIACYSDHRVGIFGVLPLSDRMEEGRKRFRRNKNLGDSYKKEHYEKFEVLAEGMKSLEIEIFNHTKISKEYIQDQTVNQITAKLVDFDLI